MNSNPKNIYLYYGKVEKDRLSPWKDEGNIKGRLKGLMMAGDKGGISTFKMPNDFKKSEEDFQGLVAVSLLIRNKADKLNERFFIKFFQEDLDECFLTAVQSKGTTAVNCVNEWHYDLKLEKKEYFDSLCKFIANNIITDEEKPKEKRRVKKISEEELQKYIKDTYEQREKLQLSDLAKRRLKAITDSFNNKTDQI